MNTETSTGLLWLSLARGDAAERMALAGTWIIKIGKNLVAVTCDGRRAHFDWMVAKQLARHPDSERFKAGVFGHAPTSTLRNAMRDEHDRWPDRFGRLLDRLQPEPLFEVDANQLWVEVSNLQQEVAGTSSVEVQLDLYANRSTLRLTAGESPATRSLKVKPRPEHGYIHAAFPSHYLIDALAPFQRNDVVSVFVGRADGNPQRVLGIGWQGYALAFLMPVEREGKG